MAAIFEVSNLTKTYDTGVQALKNVNISLESGHIVGLLGPNGAGKTTLIKIINGLLRDYQGSVKIDGHDPSPYTKSIISYLPDATYFAPKSNNTIKQVMKMFEDLYDDFESERCLSILEKFSISTHTKTRSLSKGNSEKLQLALVMSRRAKIYILDEPIAGVDPAARDFILNFIMANYSKDALLIISTHLIEDVEPILTDVVFLKNGEVNTVSNKEELIKERQLTLNQIFKEDFKC